MLNSIDFQTMIPRTAEAADMQGRELNQNQHLAEQPGIQFQQRTEQEARQTVETAKSETEEYDTGGEGKGTGGRTGNKNRRQNKKTQKEAPVAPRSNSSFDIMI